MSKHTLGEVGRVGLDTSNAHRDRAYRMYVCRYNYLRDEWWVERDRVTVAHCASLEACMAAVDAIYGD